MGKAKTGKAPPPLPSQAVPPMGEGPSGSSGAGERSSPYQCREAVTLRRVQETRTEESHKGNEPKGYPENGLEMGWLRVQDMRPDGDHTTTGNPAEISLAWLIKHAFGSQKRVVRSTKYFDTGA